MRCFNVMTRRVVSNRIWSHLIGRYNSRALFKYVGILAPLILEDFGGICVLCCDELSLFSNDPVVLSPHALGIWSSSRTAQRRPDTHPSWREEENSQWGEQAASSCKRGKHELLFFFFRGKSTVSITAVNCTKLCFCGCVPSASSIPRQAGQAAIWGPTEATGELLTSNSSCNVLWSGIQY